MRLQAVQDVGALHARTELYDDIGGLSWPSARMMMGVARPHVEPAADEPHYFLYIDLTAGSQDEMALKRRVLEGVLAQRLVRLLCDDCKRPTNDKPRRYVPVGCERCNNRGYRGRAGIFELVVLDDTMRKMVHERAAEHELETYARRLSPSIRRDGERLVLEGATSKEEVLRVTRED